MHGHRHCYQLALQLPHRFLVSYLAVTLPIEHSLIIPSTRFITDAIDYFYGLVYAGCCAALVAIVFFFVIESKDRTLEEIDTMYVQHVNPITSSKWVGEPHGPKHAREGVTDEEASS